MLFYRAKNKQGRLDWRHTYHYIATIQESLEAKLSNKVACSTRMLRLAVDTDSIFVALDMGRRL